MPQNGQSRVKGFSQRYWRRDCNWTLWGFVLMIRMKVRMEISISSEPQFCSGNITDNVV